MELKSKNGQYNLVSKEDIIRIANCEFFEEEKDNAARKNKYAKMYFLLAAKDYKMSTTSAIVRRGTPIKELQDRDLPSPEGTSTNMQSLPHQFTLSFLKPKARPTDPDSFQKLPAFQEKLTISVPMSTLHKKRKPRDYLTEFRTKIERFKGSIDKVSKEAQKD